MERREGRKDGKRKKGKEVWEISLCQKKRFTQRTPAATWTGDYSFNGCGAQAVEGEQIKQTLALLCVHAVIHTLVKTRTGVSL